MCVFAFSGVEIAGNLAWGAATVWGSRCGAPHKLETTTFIVCNFSSISPSTVSLGGFSEGREWFFELNRVIERVVIIFS